MKFYDTKLIIICFLAAVIINGNIIFHNSFSTSEYDVLSRDVGTFQVI